MENISTDVIVIGGGASGLFCAGLIAESGQKVTLLEHNDKVAKKIRISGGGRCNFTNLNSNSEFFRSENRHFVKSALGQFGPQDFIELVEQRKIDYFEKHMGQLFCTKSSKDIIELLVEKAKQAKVHTITSFKDLKWSQSESGFIISNAGMTIESKHLIVAAGGLSLPSLGASDLGYRIAKSFGHKITATRPALVGLRPGVSPKISGLSTPVRVQFKEESICEPVLVTHKSLSGPCMLKASLWWNPGETLPLDWLPNTNLQEIVKQSSPSQKLSKTLKAHLPNALVDTLLPQNLINKNWADLSKKDIAEIEKIFFQYPFTPNGTDGMRKAEATLGGVSTDKINSKNLESKLCPNLYFIGEVLDVTGQLGGHNFQWAWSSAFACARSIIAKETTV